MTQQPILGIYPKKTMSARDAMSHYSLFKIARIWKEPRCPWTDEWIKTLWYIYTREYHSAIKRNAFESVLMRWMNLNLLYRVK